MHTNSDGSEARHDRPTESNFISVADTNYHKVEKRNAKNTGNFICTLANDFGKEERVLTVIRAPEISIVSINWANGHHITDLGYPASEIMQTEGIKIGYD